MRSGRLILCFVSILAGDACSGGGDDVGDDDDGGSNFDCSTVDPPDLSNRYYPWKVGTVWTVKLSDPVTAEVMVKDTVVEAWEAVPHGHTDTCAFRVSGDKLWGNTVSWNNYEGDVGVRYAQEDYDTAGALETEQWQDPYRLKVDESAGHFQEAASYTETFEETTRDPGGTVTRAKNEDWSVISMAETVTVPAGTYEAVHLRRVNPANGKTKDFWFVQGIGKVKETGGGQDQELMAYTP
jgi:hypothetical protein